MTAEAPRARPRRRWLYTAGAILLIMIIGAAVVVYLIRIRPGQQPVASASTLPAATATITRGDVVDTESVDGTLGYPDGRELAAGTSGVITAAPQPGATIERGHTLYKINNAPVVLMYGSMPFYRTLKKGITGRDVEQLERNLKDLGYDDHLDVDDDFTDDTAAAVKKWQDDAGLPQTGTVDAGQVVFEPAAVRVDKVSADVGTRVATGRPVLTVTGTESMVEVDLDAGKQSLAHDGAAVTVSLPDGKSVAGTISSVGKVAKSASAESGSDDDNSATIEVEVKLRTKVTDLDQAPVTVQIESQRVRNVLSVPIEALLALPDGSSAVEVVEGQSSRTVPVTVGAFGSGRVEISGNGLHEGMKVGVPSS